MGSIQSDGEGFYVVVVFFVKFEDYKIKIFFIVGSKIVEVVDIIVDVNF